MAITATYQRPTVGTLTVRFLDPDEIRYEEATEQDLAKMGYVGRSEPYRRVRTAMEKALHEEDVLTPGQDLTDAHLNPLRYLFELTTYIDVGTQVGELIDSESDGQLGMDLRAIERSLQLLADGQGLEASQLYRSHLVARDGG